MVWKFEADGLRFGGSGSWIRNWRLGLGLQVWNLVCNFWDLGGRFFVFGLWVRFRVEGLEFRVDGLGFRV